MEQTGKDQVKDGEPSDQSCGTDIYHYWLYCVNCGALLESRKCKLVCPKCGFYHSCNEP